MQFTPTHLFAQTVTEAVITISEAERQVRAALAQSNATLQTVKRQGDRTLRQKLREIEDLQFEVADLRTEGAAVSARVETLRDALAQAQDRLVTELAERDRVYAEEIAVYRAAVEDIAKTPEGLAALERFNAGEEVQALEILDALRAARDQAAAARTLADARQIARLALDAWGRAKVSTASVILRFEEITKLDPSRHWDWVELSRLYEIAGDLSNGLAAAEASEAAAVTDRDRSVSLNEIGDVRLAQGDLPGALEAYTRGLEIAEALAGQDKGNAGWQRDVWVSLNKVGDVRLAQGDLPGALEAYTRGLEIAEALAGQDKGNAGWQRDVSVSLDRIGDVRRAQGDLPGALEAYTRGLEIREALAGQDKGNAGWQRDVSVSLNRIGDVRRAQGDLPGALEAYTRGLEIAEALAGQDKGNAGWQRDVSVSLNMVGDVRLAQGDLPGALEAYTRGLEIREALAGQDPGNAGWQRDVWVSLWRLTAFPESGVAWADVAEKMEAMAARGVLLPTDQQYLDHARAQAASEARVD
ncbi:TPR repeat protein [Candidatus Rhodobacter oscarellae]|uniref:TPR repeat protein n=2 Tax=Candidatus Rhodobacter oscarellae TaxID=1675527 RepID=A0A0J9H567_9RHOB|nr:TPR repeat protein [Candidatus Rhodobacter lobularis]